MKKIAFSIIGAIMFALLGLLYFASASGCPS